MRQCACGGIIRQHELVNNREAWTCGSCGRYEAIERRPIVCSEILDLKSKLTSDAETSIDSATLSAQQT